MSLKLRSAADARRFESFILHHTIVPVAAIHDSGDGLEIVFHHVVITGKSVDSSGAVGITIVYRRIAVQCGPPTCLRRVQPVRPRLHLFGHVHDQNGRMERFGTTFVNAAIGDDDDEDPNVSDRVHVIDR